MSIAIQVENVSKQYRLGRVGTGTISHDLNRWWHRVRGKEDPYLKIGEANDRSKKGDSEYVWALRDINFEIQQGDAVGIIGRNGAGKSTLLKILSRTTGPTSGQLRMKGRVASLLEVGTGFHPELTGRENIFLNGAILGMTRHEIQRKFDEIVDFSGVERYIDTPVKRYSSGMYVRLAFAVAAHLESEILIVDEVLAVGDAEFQKKCLGKMGEVSKGEGRTVLFVSHNLKSIEKLCPTSILLNSGEILNVGITTEILKEYKTLANAAELNVPSNYFRKYKNGIAFFKEVKILNQKNEMNAVFGFDEPVTVEAYLFVNEDIKNYIPSLYVDYNDSVFMYTFLTDKRNEFEVLKSGHYRFRVIIDSPRKKGFYSIILTLHNNGRIELDRTDYKFGFNVDYDETLHLNKSYSIAREGNHILLPNWEVDFTPFTQ